MPVVLVVTLTMTGLASPIVIARFGERLSFESGITQVISLTSGMTTEITRESSL